MTTDPYETASLVGEIAQAYRDHQADAAFEQFDLRAQRTWQRRAARILADLLDQGERDGLPVLEWSINHVGVQITGRSFARPSTSRRVDITAWARALDIELREHRGAVVTTVTGVAKERDTKRGFATIVLMCDVDRDDEDQP